MEYGGVDGRVTGLLSRPFIDVCECQSRSLYGLLQGESRMVIIVNTHFSLD